MNIYNSLLNKISKVSGYILTITILTSLFMCFFDDICLFATACAMPESAYKIITEKLMNTSDCAQIEKIPQKETDVFLDNSIKRTTSDIMQTTANAKDFSQTEFCKIEPLALPENEFGGKIFPEKFASGGNEPKYIKINSGYIKNTTKVAFEEVKSELGKDVDFKTHPSSEKPQVLIFHTHTTESFDLYNKGFSKSGSNSRSTDPNVNMVRVGNAISAQLKLAGIEYIHDTSMYDFPSYNGAYGRSNSSVKKILTENPSIKIVLDIHRDAIYANQNDWTKPITEINGKSAAQLMIITGADDGTLNNPDWRFNLRFAAKLQDTIEADYPTLTRPLMFAYRNYNQQVSHGALLIEIGGHGNFLGEAVYSGELLGRSLSKVIYDLQE